MKKLLRPLAFVLSGSGRMFLPLIGLTVSAPWHIHFVERYFSHGPAGISFLWVVSFFAGIRRRHVGCQVTPRRSAL